MKHDIIEINEIKEYGVFTSEWRTTWIDERLKWPTECQKEEKEPPDFVESELLYLLWNGLKVVTDLANTEQAKCHKTFQIKQTGEISIDCKLDLIHKTEFDFTWYPFDAHTFKVPFVSGKRIMIVVKIRECYDCYSKFLFFFRMEYQCLDVEKLLGC